MDACVSVYSMKPYKNRKKNTNETSKDNPRELWMSLYQYQYINVVNLLVGLNIFNKLSLVMPI